MSKGGRFQVNKQSKRRAYSDSNIISCVYDIDIDAKSLPSLGLSGDLLKEMKIAAFDSDYIYSNLWSVGNINIVADIATGIQIHEHIGKKLL